MQASQELLVVVSPYPPLKTGVADYVKELVHQLKGWYQLILVVEHQADIVKVDGFPGKVISQDTFLMQPQLHKRVLYHVGNSSFHTYIINLLAKVPGVVVLHDFYLGESAFSVANHQNEADKFIQLLFDCHGTAALWTAEAEGLIGLAKRLPCSLNVLLEAKKVIVHSEHAVDLACSWFGLDMSAKLTVIPHLKQLGKKHSQEESARIKTKLGLEPSDFVFATYGFGGPLKGHQEIIGAWLSSDFAAHPHTKLLIIGEYPDPRYLQRMKNLIRIGGGAKNIIFTGYSEPGDYNDYLSATDVAIQLRLESRGESSGTVLDCLAAGIPTIVTNTGSFKEIPDVAAWKVEGGEYLSAQLMAAMETLYKHQEIRTVYRDHAIEYVHECHSPAVVSDAYNKVIETAVGVERADRNQLKPKRRLFVDITALAYFDLKTGIQRVTRSLLAQFMAKETLSYQVEPVYLHHDGRYRLARRFVLNSGGLESEKNFDEPITPIQGDIFFGLDLHPGTTPMAAGLYQKWRTDGVKIYFLLHDLLPIRRPEWFPSTESPKFLAWLETVVAYSDGVIAVSKTSADDLIAWVRELPSITRPEKITKIGWFHNGADISASIPTTGLPHGAVEFLQRMGDRVNFLMVSTVEPRKGYKQTLEAFTELWNSGADIDLVIVGKQGWMVDDLVQQMQTHPRYGRNLFWLQGISDEYLEAIYSRSTALIAASEGEGFGLPIIEAATHHAHVIARDIPVFREVAGSGADYFNAESGKDLAAFLEGWLAKSPEQRADPTRIRLPTWQESADRVLAFLLEESGEETVHS